MIEYQKVIITPDVFSFIRDSYTFPDAEDIDFKSYKQNLKLKQLVLDKRMDGQDILSQTKCIVQNSNDLSKNKIEMILEEFVMSGRITFRNVETIMEIVDNPDNNYILNLARVAKTKVINSQKKSLLFSKSLKEFEIADIQSFIKPPSLSSIFSLERDIELLKGTKFNIYKSLEFYWLNTKSLIVEDDYLRKKDDAIKKREGQFIKLLYLIKACRNLEKLIIRTTFSDTNQKSEQYLSKSDFQREIKNQTGLDAKIEEIKVGERHYYTDYFKIDLGKGLDFFNIKKDYEVWRPKHTIRITPINKHVLNEPT